MGRTDLDRILRLYVAGGGGGGVVCGGGLGVGCIDDNGETSRGEAGRECGGESIADGEEIGGNENVGGFRVFVMRALVEKMGERRRECRKEWRLKGGRGVKSREVEVVGILFAENEFESGL
ncbi:hypothetical protein P3X46_022392 [Hevea brasiliensis]|uniref:Uncharacterized protein n=1 Tax=Hevea brasiliensis TaxID=3981 RepID=A0ABQ9L7T2_HEVBR|nr:hypothetical protein P3X46_022392 [Hevea brasiliensis]